MHAPYESLAKSPLNDTPTRAVMPARLKVSLQGSPALHVTAQFPGPQRINPLRAFGTMTPRSVPDEVQVYDQSYRNHPADLIYFLPPPALRPLPGWDLCRAAWEIHYATKYQDTEEMRLDMRKALIDLEDEIDHTHHAIGPTPRDYKRWKETIERGRIDALHSYKAYNLGFYSKDARTRCGDHISEMNRLVTRARRAVRSYGPVSFSNSHSSGAMGQPQSNQLQPSNTQRPVNTFRQLPRAGPVRMRPRTTPTHYTVEQAMQARHPLATTSTPLGVSAALSAVPVLPSFPAAQNPAAPAPADSSSSPVPVSPSPKLRGHAPRTEISPRRLRSTTKALRGATVPTSNLDAPVITRTCRIRLRVQAPKDRPVPRKPTVDASKAKKLRTAKVTASSVPEEPAYTQTRYNLRSLKRNRDDEEPAQAVNSPPAPRPVKRRRN